MSTTTPRNLGIVGMALLLGVLGDSLLRATPWGINLPLWLGVAAAGGWALAADRTEEPGRFTGWPVVLILFFASCLAWRDSNFLAFWNVVAVLAALSLLVLQMRGVRLATGRIWDYVLGAGATGVNSVAGAFLLSKEDVGWDQVAHRHVTAAVVGTLLAVPLLLVFGGLLVAADPGFERLVQSAVDVAFSTFTSHLVLGGAIAWSSAGFFRPIAAGSDPVFAAGVRLLEATKRRPSLSIIELGIPLGALVVLFLTFVGIQARYVFGGADVILATSGLTYAEYARTGFFQLVAAVTLLVPVLLAADWLLVRDSTKDLRMFRILATALLVSTGFIMLSAMQRMLLYLDAYGLTEERFYATAFMGWIGVVLTYLAATVLRGRRPLFAFGAVASGFGLLAVLNFVNPDGMIARVNLSRVEAGKALDVEYVRRLSADAVPRLATGLSNLDLDTQCDVFQSRLGVGGDERGDWRTWNRSRSVARRLLREISLVCRSP